MNANSGNNLFGFCEILVLLPANRASEMFMTIPVIMQRKYRNSLPIFSIFVKIMTAFLEKRDYIELIELQQGIRDILEENLPDRVWVRAELSSVQVKANGHCYLELSQSDGGGIIAKVKAVIWRSRFAMLSSYFRQATGSGLQAGMSVLLRVQVSFSEIYGLTLVVDDIDAGFSLGEAELEKRRTIKRLEEEDLLDRQKMLSPTAVPYRLAVISARDAAGFGDFRRHLEENEYGFVFAVDLFEAAMQGETAPASISDAIDRIETSDASYDAVLVMRGGGSVLDLACFDDYGLCFTIANCGIPVYTAIGHDRDYHVADMVAYSYVKTPTALADLFIDALAAEDERIASFGTRLRMAFNSRLSAIESSLAVLQSRIHSADPDNLLSRGYSLVTDSRGVVLKSPEGLAAGDRIRVIFKGWTLYATVDGCKQRKLIFPIFEQ